MYMSSCECSTLIYTNDVHCVSTSYKQISIYIHLSHTYLQVQLQFKVHILYITMVIGVSYITTSRECMIIQSQLYWGDHSVISQFLWGVITNLCIVIHGYPQLSIVIPSYPQLSVVIHSYPQLSVVIHSYPQLSIVIHSYPQLYHNFWGFLNAPSQK